MRIPSKDLLKYVLQHVEILYKHQMKDVMMGTLSLETDALQLARLR